MSNQLNITRGVNNKPAASSLLLKQLINLDKIEGQVFTGYPLIATPEGKLAVDATLLSPSKGLVLFDIVEGIDLGNYSDRQDDIANKLEAKLKLHRELLERRKLLVDVYIVTFAPAIKNLKDLQEEGYPLANEQNLKQILAELTWEDSSEELYLQTLSAIENLSSIRKSSAKREVTKPNSRGARLKELEGSIATLDHRQNQAVIETVDGVQRIRGLAGSGKTIVLALKAAYLHTQHPNWRIAVTFQTRSLKGQLRRLINNFCIEQSGEEPDWTKIRVINAWGAPGGEERDGVYYEFCRSTGTDFYDYRNAAASFGGGNYAFDGACKNALIKQLQTGANSQLYDVILVDEAQDFKPSFLQLCYAMVKEPKRLVYAYDELQNLSGVSMLPPEEIFGVDQHGQPLVTFNNDSRRDVILHKCYRNSRPTLVTAHALGFGVYRAVPPSSQTGLVQMFDYPNLWKEIGYEVVQGTLAKGESVVLERTNETSPTFLENHSPIDDLIIFKKFNDAGEQQEWLIQEIKNNLQEDELRHDDIVVINPNPITARRATAALRQELFNAGIQNHLAGVDTDSDVFFKTDTQSITFSGIYRAKGNEAGMVYVINAQDCNGSGPGLATLRNQLFTAITRSKAWVRVIGYGPAMQELVDEFETLKEKDFKLDFYYPDQELLSKLRIVHRDLSSAEQKRLEQKKNNAEQFAADLSSGELHFEDLDPRTKEILRQQLGLD